jgi:hypothetical protein
MSAEQRRAALEKRDELLLRSPRPPAGRQLSAEQQERLRALGRLKELVPEDDAAGGDGASGDATLEAEEQPAEAPAGGITVLGAVAAVGLVSALVVGGVMLLRRRR